MQCLVVCTSPSFCRGIIFGLVGEGIVAFVVLLGCVDHLVDCVLEWTPFVGDLHHVLHDFSCRLV